MNIRMYTITHKLFNKPPLDEYIPLQVGAEINESLQYLKDNTNENISNMNKNFCELTGVYWIWKNDRDSDVIGISHYRRYFTKKSRKLKKVLNKEQIKKIFDDGYDIILPQKEIYRESAYEQYCISSGFEKDLEKIKDIIDKRHNEYKKVFDEVMSQNKMYQYNMLICSRDLYNRYCDWLFDILFELKKDINLDEYNDYQKRIYGFLSERLLNVWVIKNNLKVKELKVINTEEPLKTRLRIKARRLKNRIIFYINKKIKIKNKK